MNTIPPVDLTRQHKVISQEVENRVLEVLRSGRYIGGAAVSDFESQFANYIGTKYSVGCNSGTDALYMALRALEIGAGDEVITHFLYFYLYFRSNRESGCKTRVCRYRSRYF